jgi:hypothetical protein
MPLTNFPNGVTSFGIPVLPGIPVHSPGPTTSWIRRMAPTAIRALPRTFPFATLYRALSLCTSGNNDVVVLIGNGASSGSARLSTALAQTIDSTVTAGTLVWDKDATHLIGVTAPTGVAARARIAPPSGTYTQSTFGSGNFVTVSGSGCYFSNFSLYNGFSTGGNNQICWTDTGGRNFYSGIQFGGAGDAASAQSTTSRSLLLSGGGEH